MRQEMSLDVSTAYKEAFDVLEIGEIRVYFGNTKKYSVDRILEDVLEDMRRHRRKEKYILVVGEKEDQMRKEIEEYKGELKSWLSSRGRRFMRYVASSVAFSSLAFPIAVTFFVEGVKYGLLEPESKAAATALFSFSAIGASIGLILTRRMINELKERLECLNRLEVSSVSDEEIRKELKRLFEE